MRAITLACAAAAAALGQASADEAWSSTFGEVYWETTIENNTAVFSYFVSENGEIGGRIYLPGMAEDMMGGRGTYEGYWVEYDGGATCQAQLVDPLGTQTDSWGRIVLTFESQQFPSAWRAVWNNCFAEPAFDWTGEPLTSEDDGGGQTKR